MKQFFLLLSLLVLCGSCSSSRLVDQYLNPEFKEYKFNKILVLGLAPEGGLQKQFEFTLVNGLQKHGLNAVKSVDYFDDSLGLDQLKGLDLAQLREQLVQDGFDAVILSQITGKDIKVSLGQSYRNFTKTFEVFNEDYHRAPSIDGSSTPENSPILHTQTLLYCLCPEMDDYLIWRASIDVQHGSSPEETIQDYVKILIKSLKNKDLLPAR